MASFRKAVLASAGVSLVNFLGKILSLVKILVVAAVFGASGPLDAFWAAMILPTVFPNLVRNLLVTAFVPRFMSDLRGATDAAAWSGANTLFTAVGLFAVLVTTALYAFPGIAVTMVAPGLEPDTHRLSAGITRVLALSAFFMVCVNILTAINHARQKFTLVAFESVVINIVTIACIMLFVEEHGIYSVAYGVVFGFAAQCLMLAATDLRFLLGTFRFRLRLRHPDFLGPMRHMVPLIIGYVGAILIAIADNVFASFLGEGAISAMNYGHMIAMLPVEVFAMAIVTVFYPVISSKFADGDRVGLANSHVGGIRLLLLVMIPCGAILIAFANDIVALLLQRGEFTVDDTRLTAGVAAAFGLSLLGQALMIFNFKTLNAVLKPWRQVGIGLVGAVSNVILDALLYRPLGVTGIALATAAAVTLAGWLSTRAVERELRQQVAGPVYAGIGKILLMTAGLIATMLGLAELIEIAIPDMAPWAFRVVKLSGVIPGAVVFFAIGRLLRMTESMKILESVTRWPASWRSA